MRSISYRTRARMRKGLKIGLIVLGLCLLLFALFVIYMGRFVVYTPDGVRLDFGRDTSRDVELPAPTQTGEVSLPSVEIEYGDPNVRSQETERVSGVYIDLEMLQDPEAVYQAVQELTPPCTVMIDLKGANGSFYYTTGLDGAQLADIDIPRVDAVLSYLRSRGFTMVARIKTFQDTNFAEHHPEAAIQMEGGALWLANGFYWLDPGSETTVSYLKQIVRELGEKGFKEIVFDDFRYPNGTQMVYNYEKSRSELVAGVAADLLNFFASSNITISFGNPAADFAAAEDARIYISGVTGSGVNATLKSYTQLKSPETQIIFLTGSKDRRFDEYQVLRPLLTKVIE